MSESFMRISRRHFFTNCILPKRVLKTQKTIFNDRQWQNFLTNMKKTHSRDMKMPVYPLESRATTSSDVIKTELKAIQTAKSLISDLCLISRVKKQFWCDLLHHLISWEGRIKLLEFSRLTMLVFCLVSHLINKFPTEQWRNKSPREFTRKNFLSTQNENIFIILNISSYSSWNVLLV